jgi:DNA-binding protein Fis
MITVLVLEDERKVYELLTTALKAEGYSFIDEPQSGGIIKIIKKSDSSSKLATSGKVLELQNILLREKTGELYRATLSDIEKTLIETVLERTDGNQLKAAKILGINRNTLRTKVQKFGIDVSRWKVY